MTDLDDIPDLMVPTTEPTVNVSTKRCARHDPFWRNVHVGSFCWTWMGHRHGRFGYGRVTVAGRRIMAHRRAYELLIGEIPAGLFALHACDNPQCVRPSHLFLGTLADNAHDRDAKGRTSRGKRHLSAMSIRYGTAVGNAKLTESQIVEMRRLYTGRYGQQRELARRFGIHHSAVSRILRRKQWRHVA